MNRKVTRKNFLKGAGLCALSVTALGMMDISASAAEANPKGFTPGVYEGTGQGRNGDIVVRVSMDTQCICGIEVVSHLETPALSDNAFKILPAKITLTQDLYCDGISGATLSCAGIRSAVAQAVSQAGNVNELQPDETALTGIAQSMTPGTYHGEANGCWLPGTIEGSRFGAAEDPLPVTVAVTVDETSILHVEVLTCTDIDAFIKPVLARIPAAIVDQQSIAVDAVTGCTCTSAGALSAAAQALEAAGANLLGFCAPTSKSADNEEYDVDVCVVGGGCAGTIAALAAVEAGASVLVLDKAGRLGGKGFCSSGMSAAESKVQLDAGVSLSCKSFFESLYEQSGGRINSLLVRDITAQSGNTMDYLMEHGFRFDSSSPNATWDEVYMCRSGKGQAKFDALYDDYILPGGGIALKETTAYALVMTDGAVTGVKARRQNGVEVLVNCKAAVVGTGGFGGNKSMMQEFLHSANFYDRGLTTTCSGDGIRMALTAGAVLGTEIMPHMQEFGANDKLNFTDSYIKFITYAGLMNVNPEGKRFLDETLNITDPMGYGCAALRVQGYYYLILDQAQVDAFVKEGIGGFYKGNFASHVDITPMERALVPLVTLQAELDEAIAAGEAFKAESAEDLAKAIGFQDPSLFVSEFTRYNAMCAAGADEDFGKARVFLNGYAGTLYAVRMLIPIMGTLGGVKVNERLQAMTVEEQAIPGLYIAGQEGSGFYSYPYYATKCSTSTYAYVSGRLSGLYAAEYARAL